MENLVPKRKTYTSDYFTETAIDSTTLDGKHIEVKSITASEIAAGTITATEIASHTITATQIAAGTITATQIAAGTITATELSASYIIVGGAAGDVNAGSTRISGGLLSVTSGTDFTGTWYSKSGVDISATTGINIYGVDSALTTRATQAGTIQCKVDTTGAIVAGAGAVYLDAGGLTLVGEIGSAAVMTIKKNASTIRGYIYNRSSDDVFLISAVNVPLYLSSGTAVRIYGDIQQAGNNETFDIGGSDYHHEYICAKQFFIYSGTTAVGALFPASTTMIELYGYADVDIYAADELHLEAYNDAFLYCDLFPGTANTYYIGTSSKPFDAVVANEFFAVPPSSGLSGGFYAKGVGIGGTYYSGYAGIWSYLTGASTNLYAIDAVGNSTLLSPHDPITGEYIFLSKNLKTGKTLRINMEQMAREFEKLTGKQFIIESYDESIISEPKELELPSGKKPHKSGGRPSEKTNSN